MSDAPKTSQKPSETPSPEPIKIITKETKPASPKPEPHNEGDTGLRNITGE